MIFFTSIITKCTDIAGKFRLISALANGRIIENRGMMQHFGFISVPKEGCKALFVQHQNMTICIASEGDDHPHMDEDESALYRTATHYIIMKKDGTIAAKAAGGMDLDGDLRVSGNISSAGEVSDLIGELSTLRNKYNSHVHMGNMGTATSPPTANGQDLGAV